MTTTTETEHGLALTAHKAASIAFVEAIRSGDTLAIERTLTALKITDARLTQAVHQGA